MQLFHRDMAEKEGPWSSQDRTLACGALTNGISNKDVNWILNDFKGFLTIDRQLSERTVYRHVWEIKRHLQAPRINPSSMTRRDIRDYLSRFRDSPANTYANVLKSLKVFYRDYLDMSEIVRTFRFPMKTINVITTPPKKDLQAFYCELKDEIARTMFLFYCTSGLRRKEVLGLAFEDVDFEQRMIVPRQRSRTKRTWVTFYNEETQDVLERYLGSLRNSDGKERLFPVTETYFRRRCTLMKDEIGVYLTPKILRVWFCNELGRLGVQDRYIDAFCGRVPNSILARHYTDYSPERLKRIYDRANLKVLS